MFSLKRCAQCVGLKNHQKNGVILFYLKKFKKVVCKESPTELVECMNGKKEVSSENPRVYL